MNKPTTKRPVGRPRKVQPQKEQTISITVAQFNEYMDLKNDVADRDAKFQAGIEQIAKSALTPPTKKKPLWWMSMVRRNR